MKFLITGGAGFIGSHLALDIAKTGAEVCVVDNFNDYYSPSLKRLRAAQFNEFKNIELVEMDITQKSQFENLMGKFQPDTVFHLAAQAGVRLKISEYDNYVSSNLVGFSNVLLAAIEHSVPNLLYASSSSIYGNALEIPFSEEKTTPSPISFYGATKLCNEILAASAIRNSGTKTRGLRFFTAYGPMGRPDMAYFRLVTCAITGEKFNLFGSSTVRRDFTYIDDIVRATKALSDELDLRMPGYSDVVNVGGGTPLALNDLIEEVSSLLGTQIEINEIAKNSNDVELTFADSSRLESLIGIKPETPLAVGVGKFVNWAMDGQIQGQLSNWTKSV
ncbi:WcaG Nucleoside-diphosphate-sugar epimerases [Candidatus Nanopelagicaceae bacterium]